MFDREAGKQAKCSCDCRSLVRHGALEFANAAASIETVYRSCPGCEASCLDMTSGISVFNCVPAPISAIPV